MNSHFIHISGTSKSYYRDVQTPVPGPRRLRRWLADLPLEQGRRAGRRREDRPRGRRGDQGRGGHRVLRVAPAAGGAGGGERVELARPAFPRFDDDA